MFFHCTAELKKFEFKISVISFQSKTVYVSCQADNKNDILIEQVKYYPEFQGFPGYYYPYENQKGYLSPLVAVQFIKFKSMYRRYNNDPVMKVTF